MCGTVWMASEFATSPEGTYLSRPTELRMRYVSACHTGADEGHVTGAEVRPGSGAR